MSITYIGASISPVANIIDGCSRESSNEIVTISQATPDRIQNWAASNLAAVSSVNLTNNSSARTVCMISNASACIWTGTTNMDVVNLDTGYKVNYTGSVATRTATKGQQSAGLPDYGVAIATTNTANSINKFTVTGGGATFAAGTQSIASLNGYTPTTIIAAASSFFIGTTGGIISQIDSSFTTVKSFQIPSEIDLSSSDLNTITGLSYYNGILFVSTSVGMLYQIDWMTLDVLNVMPWFNSSGTSPQGSTLCATSTGVACIGIFNSGTGNKAYNFVTAIDYRVTPPKVDEFLFLNTAQNILQTGQVNGIGWAIYQTNTLINFNIIPTEMINQTPTLLYNAQYREGQRILILDDGNTTVESDIVIPANNSTTYTVTPNKTVIDIALINTGVDKRGSVSRYST